MREEGGILRFQKGIPGGPDFQHSARSPVIIHDHKRLSTKFSTINNGLHVLPLIHSSHVTSASKHEY